MRRLGWLVVVVWLGGTVLPAQQTFRATRDAVTVDMSVMAGKRTVQDLDASHFTVLDNGIAQVVSQVWREARPLDVTLLVDASYGMNHGPAGNAMFDARHLPAGEWTRSGKAAISALLKGEDRLQSWTFASAIRQSSDRPSPALAASAAGVNLGSGRTALFDAVLAAAMLPSTPQRQSVIVALTDGLDTASAVPASVREQVLDRSNALVYLIVCGDRDFGFRPRGRDDGNFPVTANLVPPNVMRTSAGQPPDSVIGGGWIIPFGGYDWILRDLTERTGGRVIPSDVGGDFGEILSRLFDELRNRYVLSYEPRGVSREGWHVLTVTVPKFPKYEVRARKGYFGG